MPDQPIRIYRKRWFALIQLVFYSGLLSIFVPMTGPGFQNIDNIMDWWAPVLLVLICLFLVIVSIQSLIELLRIRPLAVFSEAGFFQPLSGQQKPLPLSQMQGVKLQGYEFGQPFERGGWRQRAVDAKKASRFDLNFLIQTRQLYLEVYSPFMVAYFNNWSLIGLMDRNTVKVSMNFVDGDPFEILEQIQRLQKAGGG